MKTIAITSGKGGVGKTSMSANLGIALSQLGKKVVVFDADLGLADLDIILGENAEHTLRHVARGEMQLWQILRDGPGEILWVPGGSGVSELIDMTEDQMFKFIEDLYTVASYTDILIFDTGAGINRNVTLFLEAADETLLILAPDPASIVDAYATVKTLLTRRPDAIINILVNQAENELQAFELFNKLNETCQNYLEFSLNYAGFVRSDSIVRNCVRKRKPFVLAAPHCSAAKDIVQVAESMMNLEQTSGQLSFTDRLLSAFGFGSKAA